MGDATNTVDADMSTLDNVTCQTGHIAHKEHQRKKILREDVGTLPGRLPGRTSGVSREEHYTMWRSARVRTFVPPIVDVP
jgi:hypothetical protein